MKDPAETLNEVLVKEVVALTKTMARRNTILTVTVTILAIAVGMLSMAAL